MRRSLATCGRCGKGSTLTWCGKCAGWASTLDGGLAAREGTFFDAGKNEGVHEERRVPMTRSEFQSLCFLHDGGTFAAQCSWLHNMEEKLVDIHFGGPDPSLECMATCKTKIFFFKTSISTDVKVKVSVEVDEHVEKLVRGAHVV